MTATNKDNESHMDRRGRANMWKRSKEKEKDRFLEESRVSFKVLQHTNPGKRRPCSSGECISNVY